MGMTGGASCPVVRDEEGKELASYTHTAGGKAKGNLPWKWNPYQ